MDPYTTLNLPHNATITQIQARYTHLAAQHDITKASSLAKVIFAQTQEAYKFLIDPIKRADYDSAHSYPSSPSSNASTATESTNPSSTSSESDRHRGWSDASFMAKSSLDVSEAEMVEDFTARLYAYAEQRRAEALARTESYARTVREFRSAMVLQTSTVCKGLGMLRDDMRADKYDEAVVFYAGYWRAQGKLLYARQRQVAAQTATERAAWLKQVDEERVARTEKEFVDEAKWRQKLEILKRGVRCELVKTMLEEGWDAAGAVIAEGKAREREGTLMAISSSIKVRRGLWRKVQGKMEDFEEELLLEE